jgi:hypothetical protein
MSTRISHFWNGNPDETSENGLAKKKRLEENRAQITLFDGLSVVERLLIDPGRVYLEPTSHRVVLGGIGGLSKSLWLRFWRWWFDRTARENSCVWSEFGCH